MTTNLVAKNMNARRQESAAVSTSNVADVRIIDERPFINQWRRGKRVGKGQHGRVYECHHEYLDQVVAIKVVARQESKRDQQYKVLRKKLPTTPHTKVVNALSTNENKIMREIAIMTRCNHPNVVKLQEVINDPMSSKIYMVMEFMGGGEVLWKDEDDNPVLSVSQARRVMRDAILGVEYLHFQGIIHRDIKPANLLWTTDRSRVKISDFGVSHFSIGQWIANGGQKDEVDPILDDDRDLSKRAGTPAFLAPELVYEHMPPSPDTSKQKPPITAAIDIWALGATFYCLLFGRTPFNPAPGIPSGIAKEFSIYTAICSQDWSPLEFMGVDRIPTGGRHPKEDPKDDGYLVMKLLDQLLQKEVAKRMLMKDLKNYPWLSLDLKAPCLWLEKSVAQTPPIQPTASETSSPLTSMVFSYGLNRIGSLLRLGRRRSSRRSKRTESIGLASDPSMSISRHRSTPTGSQPGSPSIKVHHASVRSTRDKGKYRPDLRTAAIESNAETAPISPLFTPKGSKSSLRIKSRQRPVSQIFDSKSHTPRMSETSLNGDQPRSRFHLNLSSVFGWRPHKSSSQLSSPASPPSGTVTSVPSELMTPGLAHTNESLKSGMRASSWASNAFDYDVTSVHSDAPELDDEALFVGAGGVLIDGSRSRAFISRPGHRSQSRGENLDIFDDDRFDDICDNICDSPDNRDGDGYDSDNYSESESDDAYDDDVGIEINTSAKKNRTILPPDSRSPTPSIR